MYRIGVDLGGTKIAVGLVDEGYRIVTKATLPTGAESRQQRLSTILPGSAKYVPTPVCRRPDRVGRNCVARHCK